MSKQVKVLKGQTLVDIVIQELGDADRTVEVAELNEMNITDELTAGDMITVPDFDVSKRAIVNAFINDAFKPASGIGNDEDELVIPLTGIDYWAIENDFVVQ